MLTSRKWLYMQTETVLRYWEKEHNEKKTKKTKKIKGFLPLKRKRTKSVTPNIRYIPFWGDLRTCLLFRVSFISFQFNLIFNQNCIPRSEVSNKQITTFNQPVKYNSRIRFKSQAITFNWTLCIVQCCAVTWLQKVWLCKLVETKNAQQQPKTNFFFLFA